MFATAAAVLFAGVHAASAQPTTFGVEWETSTPLGIGEGSPVAVFQKEQDGGFAPYYLDTKGKPTTAKLYPRLFCSTAPSPVDPSFPLLAWTYDYGGNLKAYLEIVSGPLTANDPGWGDVLALLSTYAVVVDGACLQPDNDRMSLNGIDCMLTVETLVKRINAVRPSSVTTACYGPNSARNLTPDAASFLLFTYRGHSDARQHPGRLRGDLYGGLVSAWTQINVGLDLASYLAPGVGELFDGDWTARDAWIAIRKQAGKLKNGAGEPLSNELEGFVGLAFVNFHTLFDYMWQHPQRGAGGKGLATAPLSKLVEAVPITDALDATTLKNHHVVLPKSPISAVYAEVVKRDVNDDPLRRAAAAVWHGRDAAWFCQPEVIGNDPLKGQACVEFFDNFWKPRVLDGVDPFSLARIARTVLDVIFQQGKIRVVFEVRSGSDLLRSRQWKVSAFDWAAPIAVPHGLP